MGRHNCSHFPKGGTQFSEIWDHCLYGFSGWPIKKKKKNNGGGGHTTQNQ